MAPLRRPLATVGKPGFVRTTVVRPAQARSPSAVPATTGRAVRAKLHGSYRPSYLVLLAMVILGALYVVLHSALRGFIAALVHAETRGCYFCLDAYPWATIAGVGVATGYIALALLAASQLADRWTGTAPERPIVFGLVALSSIAVPSAAIGAVGYGLGLPLLKPPVGPLLASVPAGILVAVGFAGGWRPRWPRVNLTYVRGLPLVVGAIALGLMLTSVAVSLRHPPSGTDALGYHAPLAVFIWQDGDLGSYLDRAPGIWDMAHPGTAELWFGLLRLVGGESIADLGQLPFAFLGAAATAAFAVQLGASPARALVASCGFLLMPMVVAQVGAQPNDVIGATLLMASMALASAPISSWTPGHLALIGAGLGLTATTKLALLPGAAAVGLYVATATIHQHRHHGVRLLGSLCLLGIGFALVAAPWWIRNIALFQNPIYPAALPFIGRGFSINQGALADAAFVPTPAAWPLYPLLEPHDEQSGLGALFVVGALPGMVICGWRARRHPLALYWLVCGFSLPFWWLLTQHFPRFLLGVLGLGFGFLPFAHTALEKLWARGAGALLCTAAAFSALVTLDQAILPAARQPTERTEFYDKVWGVDPFVISLPEGEGVLHLTGYAPSIFPEYAAYYPLLGASGQRLVIPVDGELSTAAMVARMRRAGVRYSYVVASPDKAPAVQATYDPAYFELVHESDIVPGESSGARRHLYRNANGAAEDSSSLRRYVFELRP
jgi:hypothetical protein